MKKTVQILACLALPALLFLNAWQGFRYQQLSDEVEALERQQKDLLEGNRDVIARIAHEQSPEQVARKVEESLDMHPLDPKRLTRIQIARKDMTAPADAASASLKGDGEGGGR